MTATSPALSEYLPAFADGAAPFLTFYHLPAGGPARRECFTRGQVWSLARRAAGVLRRSGIGPGERFALYFSGNRPGDLAFRLAAAMTGAVPVTVNWHADTPERAARKIAVTGARLAVIDAGVAPEALTELTERRPGLATFALEGLSDEHELPEGQFCTDAALGPEADRIVIFTSGTTGQPKGVRLPYRAFAANRATFESFLAVAPADLFAPVVVNPMHHTNSTAITDWALRRPGTRLHLIERYSTRYWAVLAEAAGQGYDRIVAPAVSRHFDYFEELLAAGRLPAGLDELQEALRRVEFLLGSAPVGPTTVARLQEHAGRVPLVRFGSTETCLQVMGSSPALSEAQRLAAFRRGWAHTWKGRPHSGNYIGRPHAPHTEVRVVRGTVRGQAGYFLDCHEGEPGRLITRGANVMTGYVGDGQATAEVLHEGGWYTGLGDVGFWLTSPEDGERDYYWVGRESGLLIRGGANYSCAQIEAELRSFIASRYGLTDADFDVAAIGLRVLSEHEDDCCVTVDLLTAAAHARRADIEAAFLVEAARAVSKGARPDRVRFAKVPRNFKGAVLAAELRDAWARALAEQSPRPPDSRS